MRPDPAASSCHGGPRNLLTVARCILVLKKVFVACVIADTKDYGASGGYQEDRHEAGQIHGGGKLHCSQRDQASAGAQARAHHRGRQLLIALCCLVVYPLALLLLLLRCLSFGWVLNIGRLALLLYDTTMYSKFQGDNVRDVTLTERSHFGAVSHGASHACLSSRRTKFRKQRRCSHFCASGTGALLLL